MLKMEFAEIGQELLYEKLTNGLEVYLVPQLNRNNCFVTYTTRYGSTYNEFIPAGKNKYRRFPAGIAHFLEHKLFEQKSGIDPFAYFAERGAEANAATGFFHTSYIFYGSEELNNNLEYLLDFVSSPYFTDKNVEKEKGIIEQELRMYDDMPIRVLQDKLRANMFAVNPIKESIGGTVDDIMKITKEDLYVCYETFYHPSNMVLVITGNFNADEIMNLIKENQAKKKYPKQNKIEVKKYNEPPKVVKEYEEKQMIVEIPKLSIGMKIPLKKLTKFEPKVRNLYLGILGYMLLGRTSLFYEKMRDLELTPGPFHIEKIKVDDYMMAVISAESEKPEELVNEIKKLISNITIDDEDFERMKKVLIKNYVSLFDDVMATNDKILDNIINYKKVYFDEIEIIRDLNSDELKDFIKGLDLSNIATYIIKPEENALK